MEEDCKSQSTRTPLVGGAIQTAGKLSPTQGCNVDNTSGQANTRKLSQGPTAIGRATGNQWLLREEETSRDKQPGKLSNPKW